MFIASRKKKSFQLKVYGFAFEQCPISEILTLKPDSSNYNCHWVKSSPSEK